MHALRFSFIFSPTSEKKHRVRSSLVYKTFITYTVYIALINLSCFLLTPQLTYRLINKKKSTYYNYLLCLVNRGVLVWQSSGGIPSLNHFLFKIRIINMANILQTVSAWTMEDAIFWESRKFPIEAGEYLAHEAKKRTSGLICRLIKYAYATISES